MTTSVCLVCGEPGAVAACAGCRLTIAADLRAIRTSHRLLADHLAPHGGTAGSRSVPGSRPPLAVDPLSLAARGGIGGVLGSWVQLLLEEGRVTNLPSHRLAAVAYIDACCDILAAQLDWLCDQPFVDELATELTDLRHDVDAVLGLAEQVWRRLPGQWACPTDGCSGTLLQRGDEWLVRCPACRRTWDGEAQVTRLGVLLGCELVVTTEQAAVLVGLHRATINRWIDAGILPADTTTGRAMVDKRDLAVVVAWRAGA